MKFLLLYLLIFVKADSMNADDSCNVYDVNDSPNKTVTQINNKVEQILKSNTDAFIPYARDFTKILPIVGGPYSSIIAAGIEVGLQKLEPDMAQAFLLAYRHTIAKLDFIEIRVTSLASDIGLEIIEASYATIASHASLFSDDYAIAFEKAKFNQTEATIFLKRSCELHDPRFNLQLLWQLNQCSPISPQMQNFYLRYLSFIRNIEHQISFEFVNPAKKEYFYKLKNDMALLLLEDDFYSSNILKSFDEFTFNGKIDTIIEELEFMVKDKIFTSCWAKQYYVAKNHKRHELESFKSFLEHEIMRAEEQVLICANVSHTRESEILLYLNQTAEIADRLYYNLDEFVLNTIEQAFPNVIEVDAVYLLGAKTIPAESFNQTAKNISLELESRDIEKSLYFVMITDLLVDNVGSAYQCKKSLNCFTRTVNNVRLIVIRYVTGTNLTKAVSSSLQNFNSNKEWYQRKFNDTRAYSTLRPMENFFFNSMFHTYFTVIILHNSAEKESETIINAGWTNYTYQGQKMVYSFDRFNWFIFPYYNHLFKIFFFL